MFGVSIGKGEVVMRMAGLVYLLSLFLLKGNRGPLSLILTGATILALTMYFKLKRKEESVFFGMPTWIYGGVSLGLGLYFLIASPI